MQIQKTLSNKLRGLYGKYSDEKNIYIFWLSDGLKKITSLFTYL